jgi:hypothetical protein
MKSSKPVHFLVSFLGVLAVSVFSVLSPFSVFSVLVVSLRLSAPGKSFVGEVPWGGSPRIHAGEERFSAP